MREINSNLSYLQSTLISFTIKGVKKVEIMRDEEEKPKRGIEKEK
jgi:hypothetical protein